MALPSLKFHKMKAPGDNRPTWRGGIIQVHITRACNLTCTHCTQGSNLGGRPVMISEYNFEKAIWSLKDYYGVVGIFGGNPTLHPQFEKFCRILERYIPFERRGLWSNNLRGYGKLCREIFNPEVSNLNVHCDQAALEEMKHDWPECHPIGEYDSRHSPVYISMNDIEDLSIEDKWRLINNCDINQYWSAIICETKYGLRGYFCEIAGAQAMLNPDGPDLGIQITDNWWKLPITAFEDQILYHCFRCGVPLKGKGDLAVNGTKEFVSKTYIPIMKIKKKRDLIVVNKLSQLEGHVNRATDYIANGMQPRVSTKWFPDY